MEQEQTSSQGKKSDMATGKNSRFAMMHPTRVHGIVTVNNTASESLGRFTDRLKVHPLWPI